MLVATKPYHVQTTVVTTQYLLKPNELWTNHPCRFVSRHEDSGELKLSISSESRRPDPELSPWLCCYTDTKRMQQLTVVLAWKHEGTRIAKKGGSNCSIATFSLCMHPLQHKSVVSSSILLENNCPVGISTDRASTGNSMNRGKSERTARLSRLF